MRAGEAEELGGPPAIASSLSDSGADGLSFDILHRSEAQQRIDEKIGDFGARRTGPLSRARVRRRGAGPDIITPVPFGTYVTYVDEFIFVGEDDRPIQPVLEFAHLTSVLAIAALFAGLYLGWRWMDAAMGIVGAVVIARWSWGLLRDTGAVLVDAAANPGLEAEIREAIEDGDAEIADLHVWQVGPGRYAAIVSLIAANPDSPGAYAARVTIHEELVHVTVEVHRCEGHHATRLRAA